MNIDIYLTSSEKFSANNHLIKCFILENIIDLLYNKFSQ